MSLHVPSEASRVTDHPLLASTQAHGANGAFLLGSPEPGWRLALIVSDSSAPDLEGLPKWEHVSVHAYRDRGRTTQTRTPTWNEMAWVKDLCWDAEDVVMQLHPRKSEYINDHPHTLHLWRPIGQAIPTPPAIFVGLGIGAA